MKKSCFSLLLFAFGALFVHAQSFLGIFEKGDEVPFWAVFTDPATGAPADPLDPAYHILKNAQTVSQGSLSPVPTGVAVGSYSTANDDPGRYAILISGRSPASRRNPANHALVNEVRAGFHRFRSFGLNGLTPMTESAFVPYQNEILPNPMRPPSDCRLREIESPARPRGIVSAKRCANPPRRLRTDARPVVVRRRYHRLGGASRPICPRTWKSMSLRRRSHRAAETFFRILLPQRLMAPTCAKSARHAARRRMFTVARLAMVTGSHCDFDGSNFILPTCGLFQWASNLRLAASSEFLSFEEGQVRSPARAEYIHPHHRVQTVRKPT